MLWVAVASVALAGVVRVEDGHACLDRDALDEEVRATIGDAAADRIDLAAALAPGAEPWHLQLSVSEGTTQIWQRALTVAAVDCPYLPALVARSVERGLSEIPGWGLALPARPPRPEAFLAFSMTAPPELVRPPTSELLRRPGRAPRWSVGPLVSVPIVPPLRFEAEVFGFWSSFERVGAGGAQVAGAAAGAGPALLVPVGASAFRTGVRATLGPQVVLGQAFEAADIDVAPYTTVLWDTGFSFVHVVQTAVRAEVVTLALRYCEAQAGSECAADPTIPSTVEPRVRLGLAVAIGGPIGRTDVRRRDRP